MKGKVMIKKIFVGIFIIGGLTAMASSANGQVEGNEQSARTPFVQTNEDRTQLFFDQQLAFLLPTSIQKIEKQLASASRSLSSAEILRLEDALSSIPLAYRASYAQKIESLKALVAKKIRKEATEKIAAEKAIKEKKVAAEKVNAALAAAKAEQIQAEKKTRQQQALQKAAAAQVEMETETTGEPAAKTTQAQTIPVATQDKQAVSIEQTSQQTGNNTLSFLGNTISLIDAQGAGAAPQGDVAGYWQGDGSTTDGQTTHIIGHNPGIFATTFSLKSGDQISLTDRSGNCRTYTVYQVLEVNDDVYDRNGNDQWNAIFSRNEEGISLQSCIDDYWNLIVLAR